MKKYLATLDDWRTFDKYMRIAEDPTALPQTRAERKYGATKWLSDHEFIERTCDGCMHEGNKMHMPFVCETCCNAWSSHYAAKVVE